MDKTYIKNLLKEAILALDEDNTPISLIQPTTSSIRDNVVKVAKKYIGAKYLYGGKDMSGIWTKGVDCSGFVSGVLKECGINIIQGSSRNQAELGKKVDTPRPGDLIFYGNPISHVALYIGNGKIINCGSTPIKEQAYDYREITTIRDVIGDR